MQILWQFGTTELFNSLCYCNTYLHFCLCQLLPFIPCYLSHISQSFTYDLTIFLEKENVLNFVKCICLACLLVTKHLLFRSWQTLICLLDLRITAKKSENTVVMNTFFRQPVVIFKEVLFIGLYDCVFYISSWKLLYICCSSPLLGILVYQDIFLPHTSRFLSNFSCLGHVFKYLCVHSSFQLLDLMWPRKISSLLRLLSICRWVVSVV